MSKFYQIGEFLENSQIKLLNSFNNDKTDTFIFSVNDVEYKVDVNTDLMKKMNWSWESLIFANNLDVFATVLDNSNNESSVLNTNGEVKVYDLADDTELSKEDIIKLALSGEIDNPDKYNIDANNWFGVDYMKNSSLVEDIVFEATPTTSLGVATEMMKFHLNYFDKK